MPLSAAIGLFVKRISWKEDENRKRLLDQRYDLNYTGFPTQKGTDLYRLTRLAEKSLPQITCPLLAVQSLADQTVSPQSADIILKEARSRTKERLILQNAPHVCTISDKLPEIVEAVDRLMKTV